MSTDCVTPPTEAATVVPKGLRSYESDDADFFLQILPGPRDSRGLPEGIRFWKHRIESDDPDHTFRAGVIYGPSGCGKSSFVRAGLVPQLSHDILPIVVSAMLDDTEERLQRSITAACPELAGSRPHEGLAEMLRAIRVDKNISGHRCVLLVIDQFEQWLNQGHSLDSRLIDALRQCDGVRLKCLFLVRNDFWMSISRVMEDLEAPIEQGKNAAPIELFDLRHAHRVLHAFGHAYGALPASSDALTEPQREFLDESVHQLARDGRVICVRLAVYAQMVRDKPWEPKTLAGFGGVQGLGARFLEETFYGASAGPQYSRFRIPAQRILRSLLPTPGSDLRGAMLSEEQLAEVAQLPAQELKRLLRLLSEHLKLLTPTDANGAQLSWESSSGEPQEHEGSETVRNYQLAHDYLVPSLRTWLSAKQHESRVGRAWLCLEDRAAFWKLNRESRQLPSWWETLRIVLWTRSSDWTDTQASMMKQARSLRLAQACLLGLCLLFLAAAFSYGRSRLRQSTRQRTADALVDQLKTARIGEALPIVTQLDAYDEEAEAGLMDSLDQAPLQNSAGGDGDAAHALARQRFLALLALSRRPGTWTNRLLDACRAADADTIVLAKQRIRPFINELVPAIETRLRATNSGRAMLRYAALLPDAGSRILTDREDLIGDLCEALTEEDPYELERFSDQLTGSAELLKPALVEIFGDAARNETQRAAVARPLAKYADEALLTRLLLTASPAQHFILISKAERQRDRLVQAIESELSSLKGQRKYGPQEVRTISNAVITLLRLSPGSPRIDDMLSQQVDFTARTRVMLQCHQFGVPLARLWETLQRSGSPIAKQALILAIGEYHNDPRVFERNRQVVAELIDLAGSSPHQSVRSAAETVLRRWAVQPPKPSQQFRQLPQPDSQRDWWLNEAGLIMVVLNQPIYAEGPQALIIGRDSESSAGSPIGSHRFAISASEVSREQLSRKEADFKYLLGGEDDRDWPANNVYSVVAMRYCRWLSEQENIPEEEMCYPPVEQIELSHLHLSDEQLRKTSYRLPTEAEWEYACAAGTRTRWSHGWDEDHLTRFCCFAANSRAKLFPVASLYPNAWGLYDFHGNVAEWCHPAPRAEGPYALRGGNYTVVTVKTYTRQLNYPGSKGYSFTGFRVARTMGDQTARVP